MSRLYIYPEQEPGRERTSPFYEEQEMERRQERRGRESSRMAYGGYDGGYEGRSRMRGSMESRMEGRMENRMEGRMARMEYAARPIGFEARGRGGYSMHGGGSKGGEYEMGGSMMKGKPLSEEDAEEWVYSMKSADGTKSPKFKYEEVERMLKQKGWKCDPLDVWVGMNALYSDLCEVNAKFGITAEHKEYWLEAACAYWLDDEDAVEDKLSAYYNYIVK